MPERTPDSTTTALARPPTGELARRPTALEVIAAIPEEEIWLAGLKSDQTRRANCQEAPKPSHVEAPTNPATEAPPGSTSAEIRSPEALGGLSGVPELRWDSAAPIRGGRHPPTAWRLQ